ADQRLGEVAYAQRLSHVENQDVAVLAYRERLQNQRHRFGDGHKITGHVGMGHGNGAARAYLLLEHRYYAALRSKNVAKAYGNTAHPRWFARTDDHFAEPLGATHQAAWVDRFVR